LLWKFSPVRRSKSFMIACQEDGETFFLFNYLLWFPMELRAS